MQKISKFKLNLTAGKAFALGLGLLLTQSFWTQSFLTDALSAPAWAAVKDETTKETESADELKNGLKYSHSAGYQKEFSAAVKKGRDFIEKYLKENKNIDPSSLAVVSDIDETILDNRAYMEEKAKAAVKAVDWSGWEDWMAKAEAKPLPQSIALLKFARSKGIAVFLITGRQEHMRRATIANLIKAGIVYDGLYMRKDHDRTAASQIKPEYRKQIEDMGYKILVNIGDQESDLSGGYSLSAEKLPNKMYTIK